MLGNLWNKEPRCTSTCSPMLLSMDTNLSRRIISPSLFLLLCFLLLLFFSLSFSLSIFFSILLSLSLLLIPFILLHLLCLVLFDKLRYHAAELPFVFQKRTPSFFGGLVKLFPTDFTHEELDLSNQIIALWSQLSKEVLFSPSSFFLSLFPSFFLPFLPSFMN